MHSLPTAGTPPKLGQRQPAPTLVAGNATQAVALRHREVETKRMIAAIDDKITRLTAARNDRQNALNKIRTALACNPCRPVRTDNHECLD